MCPPLSLAQSVLLIQRVLEKRLATSFIATCSHLPSLSLFFRSSSANIFVSPWSLNLPPLRMTMNAGWDASGVPRYMKLQATTHLQKRYCVQTWSVHLLISGLNDRSNEILRSAFKLKGMKISTSEEFSFKARHVRKYLWQRCIDERQSVTKTILKYEKLAIGIDVYVWYYSTNEKLESKDRAWPRGTMFLPPRKTHLLLSLLPPFRIEKARLRNVSCIICSVCQYS